MITRRQTLLGAGALFFTGTRAQAAPPVKGPVRHEVIVRLATQQMRVLLDGRPDAVWPVSTARAEKRTPTGSWSPDFLSRNHRSSLYKGAPMPFSIFFSGNYAIHGTTEVEKLGQPASAGCVRLSPENAEVLFDRAERDGLRQMRITILA
jgi:lipoprotein-anchoring transpeptidase ErfK/SrfK